MTVLTTGELYALRKGDVIEFKQGKKVVTATVLCAPSLRSDRNPGAGRILITAVRKMRPLTRAQEELPAYGLRGKVEVRGDKVLSITKGAK